MKSFYFNVNGKEVISLEGISYLLKKAGLFIDIEYGRHYYVRVRDLKNHTIFNQALSIDNEIIRGAFESPIFIIAPDKIITARLVRWAYSQLILKKIIK